MKYLVYAAVVLTLFHLGTEATTIQAKAQGLKCYKCQYQSKDGKVTGQENCGEKFKTDNMKEEDAMGKDPFCYKMVVSEQTDSTVVILRGGSPQNVTANDLEVFAEESYPYGDNAEVTIAICHTNDCNSATSISLFLPLIFSVVIMVILSK